MIDKNKEYSLNKLLDIYDMYNIDFKYYGNNKNGELELYLKTDTDNDMNPVSWTQEARFLYEQINL